MAAIAAGRDPDAGKAKPEPFENLHKGFLERYFGSRSVRHAFIDAKKKQRERSTAQQSTAATHVVVAPKKRERITAPQSAAATPPPPTKLVKTVRKEALKKPLPKRGRPVQKAVAVPVEGYGPSDAQTGLADDHTARMLRVGHEKIREATVQKVSWVEKNSPAGRHLEAVWTAGPAAQFRDTRSAYYTPQFRWNALNWRVAFYQNTVGQLGVWLVQDKKGVNVDWGVELLQKGQGEPKKDKVRSSAFTGELSGKGIFAPNCGTRSFISIGDLFSRKSTYVVDDNVTFRLSMRMNS